MKHAKERRVWPQQHLLFYTPTFISSHMSSISLSSVCLKVKRSSNHGIDVHPSGAIALFSGRICTILLDVGSSIEPFRGFEPFPTEISKISWCKGPDANCYTPLHLFICDEKGHGMVFDAVANKTFVEFNVKEGFITAAQWDSSCSSNLLIGTSTGRLSMLRLGEKSAESLWSVNFTFRVDFVRISPFDSRRVVVASKDGRFSIAKAGSTDSPGGMVLSNRQLVDIYFHPNFNDVLVMVQPREVRIFFTESKETILYQGNGHENEDILGAYFPDNTSNEAIVMVYASHAIFLTPSEKGFATQHLKLLASLKSGAAQILDVACVERKLYFMGIDNSLLVYELRGKSYWATKIMRNVATKPKHFVSIDSTLAFGCKNGVFMTSGYCDRINTCSMKMFFKVCLANLDQIVAVDPNRFIITAFGDERQRVFFVDIARREITSLLKSSLEMLAQWPVKISTSISREYVAIIVANTTLCFYFMDGAGCHLIKTLFLGPGPNFGTFSESSREYWVVNGKLIAEKYVIDQNSREIVEKKSTIILAKASQIGVPTSCTCSHNKFIVGTEGGSVAILSPSESPLLASINDRGITDVVLSPDHQCCYVRDVKGQKAWINLETLDVAKSENRCDELKFANSNELITRSGYVLNLCDSSHLVQAHTSCASIFDSLDIFQPQENIRQNFLNALKEPLTPAQFGKIARFHGYSIIAQLVECASENAVVPQCMCANFVEDSLKSYLTQIITYLGSPKDKSMHQLKLRCMLIQKDFEGAFQMLLATPADSPDFSLNILKASLINNSEGRSLAPSVAALVAGAKYDDAIDVLLLTKSVKEAARLLITEDRIEMAIHLMRTQFTDEDTETLLAVIEKALLSTNRHINAVAIYIALHRFDDAARILREFHLDFAADVISALTFANGKFTLSI